MTVVRELIDAELDGVCGGFFDTTNLNQLTNKIIANVQTNTQNGAPSAAAASSVRWCR